MAVGDAHVFPGFPTPELTHLFFPKPPTTFLTCFSRGERQKCARKEVCLNWLSNSQPPVEESNTLTTEPPGLGFPFQGHQNLGLCGKELDKVLRLHWFLLQTLTTEKAFSSQ